MPVLICKNQRWDTPWQTTLHVVFQNQIQRILLNQIKYFKFTFNKFMRSARQRHCLFFFKHPSYIGRVISRYRHFDRHLYLMVLCKVVVRSSQLALQSDFRVAQFYTDCTTFVYLCTDCFLIKESRSELDVSRKNFFSNENFIS